MADAHFVLAEFVEWFMPRLYEMCVDRDIDPEDPLLLCDAANVWLCAQAGAEAWDSIVYTYVSEHGTLVFATYGPADLIS